MKKKDKILILICVLVSLISFGVIYGLKKQGAYVSIYVDQKMIKQLDLNENQTYEIDTLKGKNILIIKNGEAYMKEADCRDHLCMKQGHISKTGESIICLPHKVVIKISKGKE